MNYVGFPSDDFVAILKCGGLTYDLVIMRDDLSENEDRRRSPRFSCSGPARIISLPSEGVLVSGRLRDLSLNGCGIETDSPLECGARAEILVRVNASSFRAVGQVRAIRVPFRIGLEFIRLSAGGQGILAELIRELARQQAIASVLRAARREMDAELLSPQRALLNSLPLVGRMVSAKNDDESLPVVNWRSLIAGGDLDLLI